MKVTNQTLLKIPFDLEHWQKVADERYPNGLSEPYSDDPTQWLFNGKDRGMNPDGTERHNDVHLTLAEKQVAREAAQKGANAVAASDQGTYMCSMC